MAEKPRNSILRLLSEPAFDFTPYFEKAVVQWLERNMSDFLAEAPEACAFFIKDIDYVEHVARFIPIENEQLVATYLKSFGTEWRYTSAFLNIAPRLIAAKKADLLMNCVDNFKDCRHPEVKNVINALSDTSILELTKKVNMGRLRWDTETKCAFIARVPEDYLTTIDPLNWEWYDAPEQSRAISAMAKKWPLKDVGTFLEKYGSRYSELRCMHCNDRTAKSRPGYTLHRKTCDPNNETPNIWTTIAERTHKKWAVTTHA